MTMTSPQTTASAYQQWLGISPSQHPPHHYALLGLAPGTANEQAIVQAYQQRAMIVGRELSGPQADAARRVLSELAAAQACLLNTESRAAYDAWLAPRLTQGFAAGSSANQSRPSPRTRHEPPPTATAVPLAAAIAAPPVLLRVDEHEPSSAVPWLVGGVCAGLLAVAVLGVALFGMLRSPRQTVAGAAGTQRPSQPDPPSDRAVARTATNPPGDATFSRSTDDDVLGANVAPLTTKPEKMRLDDSLIGPPDSATGDVTVSMRVEDDDLATRAPASDDEKPTTDSTPPPSISEEPPPASPLAKLPRTFALPSRAAAGGEGLLAQLPLNKGEEVKLKLDLSGVAGAGEYDLLAASPGLVPGEQIWPVQHTAADGTPRSVGEYALTGDELRFRWADSAQASDDALANAALAVAVGNDVVNINQRSPDATAPLRLAVDAGAVATSAKIDDPPPDAKLYFALDNQGETLPTHQLSPEEPVRAGDDIQLIFGEATDPYRLGLRVSLVDNGAGGVRIEARPMMQSAGDGQKWDLFKPKAVTQTLALMKQQQSLLDAQLPQLQQRFRRNAPQLQQAMDQYNRQAGELQTRIQTLEHMQTLCEELNDHGALNYRVFAKLGGREVDLLDSSLGLPVAVAAEPAGVDTDDPSGIVGPPSPAPGEP